MRNLLILLMLIMIVGIYACNEDPSESIVQPAEPTIEELEAKVIENCNILEAAIEEYKDASASRHPGGKGIYPPSVSTDPYNLGITLLEFLPDGELLENPFTGERTEPIDTIATEPGQIGYVPGFYAHQVYAITGCGEDSLVTLLNNIREVENRVLYGCLLVQHTLERYIDTHDGDLPSHPDEIIEMLPGGTYLTNAIYIQPTEPSWGEAATGGQIGLSYHYLMDGSITYRVSGCGIFAAVPIFLCYHIRSTTEVTFQYTDEIIPILEIISDFCQ